MLFLFRIPKWHGARVIVGELWKLGKATRTAMDA
jgi:hypothetical protein